ncbi:Asp-tRNA(Asn)/Glu-tRNA(Gln) amidotransferase subunit GatB [Candidatus Gracilibacteria bacterium]|nr:Asp-tRNA(Asn)/Glu-tRNA(Gln) amidotransferase subunit GatB [Candidatus Gracilibacteria bacterium]MCF7898871.1 Asp-tRNA(Asn)/Glu-tRNA(Gln) amidotransferase subunit GatB [Candidatus Paceibacterota bacterium]
MSNEYITTIGLEIHAELHTNSKMWCGCKNDPYEKKPNQNICEVCMAHPGTLPVPNKEAIRKVITVGCATGSRIADFTEFDRKNYFYPDIPKGYQLSQYLLPIVSGGSVNGIELTRIHLEEDTAKSSHDNGMTLVDYNRAGVPLMELVTEPVIHTAKEAGAFARELQRILRYVGASEANLDLGQMRVEANISVSKDPKKFGTKVEVKNLNSFAAVEGAIDYEVARHIALIEEGGAVVQETRGWDENKLETFSQRKKENAHDYRYFPDPDLPKLYLHRLFDIESIKKSLPMLPEARRTQLTNDYGLKSDVVEIIISDPLVVIYFDTVVNGKDTKYATLAANYLVADIFGLLKKENIEVIAVNFPSTSSFSTLIDMIIANELSSRGAKDLLPLMIADKNLDVKKTAEEKGMIQKNDTELLKKIVEEVIAENPVQVTDYKSGKESMFMFFVGQCMKKSKGSGNPGLFQEILKGELGS